MSKRFRLGILVFGMLLAVIVGTILCLSSGREEYRDSLPLNLQAVARLDAGSIQNQFSEILTECQAEELAHSGIDFSLPIYAFIDETDYVGLLLPLRHEDRWEQFLKGKDIVIEKQRGLRWACHHQWLMVFSDDRCLMFGPLSEQEIVQMRGRMAKLMKQEESGANVLLEYVEQTDAPIRTAFSLQFAQRMTSRFLPSCAFIWNGEQKGCVTMDIVLGNRKITADVSLHGVSHEETVPFLSPVSLDCLPSLGEGQMGTMLMGLNGEDLLKTLRSNPTVRTALIALNFCLDLDQMILALDGPVTLSVPDDEDVLSGLLLTAQLKDTRFMQNCRDWGVSFPDGWGIGMDVLSDSTFCIRLPQSDICFGVKGHTLIVATSKPSFQKAYTDYQMKSTCNQSQSADCLFCMQLDIQSLQKHAAVFSLFVDTGKEFQKCLRAYDIFELRLRDGISEER